MSISLSPKENYLTVIRDHKTPEYTPSFMEVSTMTANTSYIEKGVIGETPDPFGVLWLIDVNAFGPIPAPGKFLLEDVTEWQKVVPIPNVDDYNWEKWAEEDLAGINRDILAVDYNSTVGPFERLAALMGFEGALIAMATEPDATSALLNALTDYKIELMKKAAQYYKPDTFTLFDDVATARAPFMSIEMYDEMIMPCHTRLYAACRENDILPIKHVCGKWDDLLESIIKEGMAGISSVQPENDIVGILKKYSSDFAILGGYDTVGLPGYTDDIEVVHKERERCANEYALYDGYIYMGAAFGMMKAFDDEGNPLPLESQLESLIKSSIEDGEYFRALGSPADRRK